MVRGSAAEFERKAKRAGRLRLARLLFLNELTPDQHEYIVENILHFWFPKEYAAQMREFDQQATAHSCRVMIGLEAAETGSIADAKIEVAKKAGMQSVEAMEKRMKRARKVAKRYKPDWSWLGELIEAIERRVRERDKRR